MSKPTDAPLSGFDVLDVCHRQTLIALGRLAALMTDRKSTRLNSSHG